MGVPFGLGSCSISFFTQGGRGLPMLSATQRNHVRSLRSSFPPKSCPPSSVAPSAENARNRRIRLFPDVDTPIKPAELNFNLTLKKECPNVEWRRGLSD